MLITRTSQATNIRRTLDIDITDEQIERWMRGMSAQEAFPHLSPDEREFLITGITNEEWTLFGDGDDEQDV